MWLLFTDDIDTDYCTAPNKSSSIKFKTPRAVLVSQLTEIVVWSSDGAASWFVRLIIDNDIGHNVGKDMTKDAAETLMRDIIRAITSDARYAEVRQDEEGFKVSF